MRLTTRRPRHRDDTNVIPFPRTDLDAAIARHPSSQDPRPETSRSASSGRPAGGLVRRARAVLARRYLRKLGPAVVPPLVAGAVALVAVGVIVGLVLGVALAASAYRPHGGD